MLENLKATILFEQLLKRHDINKAYAMVPPTDPWHDTISKVHDSLRQIRRQPYARWEILSHDGLPLQAVYYPCEGSRTTVLCAHGYTSHAEREWAFPGLFYLSLGFNVLIPYQRAHGPSEGKYITFGACEPRDMAQWIDTINEMTPEGNIILHGLSMGGTVVLNMADKSLKNVRCIIADAPSTGVEDMFRNVARSVFKKEAEPVAESMLARFEKLFGVTAASCHVRGHVAASRYPILFAAGSEEKQEAFLAELAKSCPQPTQLAILPGCNHGNGMYKQTELFQSTIKHFVFQYIQDALTNQTRKAIGES